jgi:hypothetical protein
MKALRVGERDTVFEMKDVERQSWRRGVEERRL